MINGDYILVKAPEDFIGKKYRGRYCYEHHLVYWQHYHIVPKDDEVIHHIDGNKHNNDISNLELISKSEHSANHTRKRGKTMVLLRCPACQKEFVRVKSNTYLVKSNSVTCCSRACIGRFTNLPKQVKNDRMANMFIKEFKDIPRCCNR